MPLGPYSDFSSCIAAQKKKGYDAETARKICGKIYWQTEDKNKKKQHGRNKK
jgi:hypothetical protein